jgi:hypothetical protein
MNATLLRRLAALEAARPAVEAKPVDEKLLIARLSLWLSGRCPEHVLSARLAATRERKRGPYTSGLSAYADACGYADEAQLCQIAFGDGEEFHRRHAAANPPSEAKREEAHHVRRAVIERFLTEEAVHTALDAQFPHWTDRPGLAAARPLRPANAEPVEVDDAVISDIGRSLLTLAARQLPHG